MCGCVRVCVCVWVGVCVGVGVVSVYIYVYTNREPSTSGGRLAKISKETYSPIKDLLKRDLLTYKRPTQKRPTHMARIKYIPHQDRW